MNNQIYIWQQVSKLITPQINPQNIPDLSSLITLARQKGIGKPISYQKTEYTEEDIQTLSPIIKWWHYLNQTSLIEFRDKATTHTLQTILIDSVLEKIPLTIYSVFCPSYKKGKGAIGYEGVTGNHTKQLIKQLIEFIYTSNSLGISTIGTIYFSDLLLENYHLLQGTSYKEDLQNNYQDFKKIITTQDPNKHIKVHLLSENPELASTIGEVGITQGAINIPESVFDIVLTRNEVFYKEELGWTDQQVKERTEILGRCYAYMGGIFRKIHPQGIMFWVESAYERGRMYSGMNQEQPIPIIYPFKHE